MAVIVALAALGVCMAFSGTRASRPQRKPSRLSRVLGAHHLNEAMREAQDDGEDEVA